MSHNKLQFKIHLDSGATVSFIRLELAKKLKLKLLPNHQLAMLADKRHQIASLGEINITVTETETKNVLLRLRALVVENLNVQVYGGQTFHLDNGIVDDVTNSSISLHNGKFQIYQNNKYGHLEPHPPKYLSLDDQDLVPHPPRYLSLRDQEYSSSDVPKPLLQAQCVTSAKEGMEDDDPYSETISLKEEKYVLPGDTYHIKLSAMMSSDKVIIIPQPPKVSKLSGEPTWTPQLCSVENGRAVYINHSESEVLHHPKHTHFQAVNTTEHNSMTPHLSSIGPPARHPSGLKVGPGDLLEQVQVNSSILSSLQKYAIDKIHMENIDAFNENMTAGYDNPDEPYEATFSFRQENKAPPYKLWVPQFNRKCQNLLQSKCDELEVQGVLADPKKYGIDVRHVSPCFIQQKARAKHKPLEKCDLSEIRFITSFNVLNDSIHPVQGRSKTYNDIIMFMGRHKYFIFADLLNSYFQVKVDKKFWKYLGIMTPYRGIKVMTRCGQGLLNSDVHLDQVLGRVLGDEIAAGYCCAARDDLFVGGASIDEAIANWEKILSKIRRSNLKITAKKVRIFPADAEVFGHSFREGRITPSSHNITSLAKHSIDDIKTIKQLRSWIGLYKTLIRHMPNLAHFMAPFDTQCGGKSSAGAVEWGAPGMVTAFNAAVNQLENIHGTVLPNPDEQLYLLPDTSKSNLSTGWVLYTKRDDKLLPVQFASAKLKKYMADWAPCELEGVGAVLAIDQVRHWINESNKTTIVLPDSKPVVDAVKMMQIGRHSKNSRLQSLLSSVNRSNVIFRHNSAKAGHHMVPDAASRLLRTTCSSKDCQVERFLRELPNKVQCMSISADNCLDILMFQHMNPAIIAATTIELAERLNTGAGPIPLASRKSWIQIQSASPECRRFLSCKQQGQIPNRKDKDKAVLNRMIKQCSVEKGLIVSRTFDNRLMKEIDKPFIPATYLNSVLTVMHVRLSHPLPPQLQTLFEKYFVAFNVKRECEDIFRNCNFCISFQRFPNILDKYEPLLRPEHPGSHMNIDVMKRASQNILVNCDLFSGYTTVMLLMSEKREDMIEGILALTTPIRHSNKIVVRVDRAPALKSLAENKNEELSRNGIKLDLGESMNKNSNCSVDRKIQELELEIKKLCPKETPISTGLLCQAVTNLNDRVRNQGLSSSQIHFSRDTIIGENLVLDDNEIMHDKIQRREENAQSSIKSKNQRGLQLDPLPTVTPGQTVFAAEKVTKHDTRDPLLVTGVDGEKVKVQKVLHSYEASARGPKINSEEIIVNRKRLYVIPQRREKRQWAATSSDPWWRASCPPWRGSSSPSVSVPTTPPPTSQGWTPLVRGLDGYDEDDGWYTVNNGPDDQDRDGDNEGGDDEKSGGGNDTGDDGSITTVESENGEENRNIGSVTSDSEEASEEHAHRGGPGEFSEEENLIVEDILGDEEDLSDDSLNGEEGSGVDNFEDDDNATDGAGAAATPTVPPATIPAFPTKNKYIRFRRHPNSAIERDSFIPTESWLFAKILDSLKLDKFGRKYFNIKYATGGQAGIYLPKGGSGLFNDLIWEMSTEEAFMQSVANQVPQTDGPIQTPESLTPNDSPDKPVEEERPDSPAWDHSPERLMADNVFLWEETPLVPLSAREIKTSEEEEQLDPSTPDQVVRAAEQDRAGQSPPEWMIWRPSSSPHARFRRMPVIRRPRVQYPRSLRDVQLERTSDLNSILLPTRPILPELVDTDRRQTLNDALDVLHDVGDLHERLI